MSTSDASPGQAQAGIRQIGPYQILGELGASNMAVVYRAFDPVVGRPLAVKVLRIPSPAAQGEIAEARARFESEVQTLSSLSPHDNIPILYHFGEDRGLSYFAMELVPGESLDKKISGGRTLRPEEAVPIIRQIACALDYAHGKGIVHRDIKPGNILLQPDGRVKIIDFGIARVGSQNLTATGVRLGTPAYMSPEQIKGACVYGPADQFSLGVLAYRVLTGKMPFGGQDELAYYNILHTDAPAPSVINPTLPARLDAVLWKALQKLPDSRFGTCGEFASTLEQSLTLASNAAAGRKPRRLAAVLASVACIAAVAGMAGWRALEQRTPPAAIPSSVTPRDEPDSPVAPAPSAPGQGKPAPSPRYDPPDPRPPATGRSPAPKRNRSVAKPGKFGARTAPQALPLSPKTLPPKGADNSGTTAARDATGTDNHSTARQAGSAPVTMMADHQTSKDLAALAHDDQKKSLDDTQKGPGGGIGNGTGTGIGYHYPGEGGGVGDSVGDGTFRVGGGVSAPSVLTKVDPEYSEEARKAKYSGTVLLSVIVDTEGKARDIHVIKSLGMGLDEKAMEAVAKWRFKPGMKGGQPVNVRAQIEVNFRICTGPC